MRYVVLLALTLVAGGCAQSFDATRLGVPVTMASTPGEAAGEPFRVRATSIYFGFGLLSLSQPSLEKALAGQLLGGKSVTDLKIRVRSRWTDLLITGLTLGLFVPRTVEFEGVVR